MNKKGLFSEEMLSACALLTNTGLKIGMYPFSLDFCFVVLILLFRKNYIVHFGGIALFVVVVV